MIPETTSPLAELFKALGHPVRIRLVNILNQRETSVEELAELVERSPATVLHHLSLLRRANLVQSRREQYYRLYRLNQQTWGQIHRWLQGVTTADPHLEEHDRLFRRRIFQDFFQGGRFLGFPPQKRSRRVLLQFFSSLVIPGAGYTKEELEDIYSEFTARPQVIISALAEAGILKQDDGNRYRVTDAESMMKILK
jgi:DNA-binding transcriptional ArsR family regulator